MGLFVVIFASVFVSGDTKYWKAVFVSPPVSLLLATLIKYRGGKKIETRRIVTPFKKIKRTSAELSVYVACKLPKRINMLHLHLVEAGVPPSRSF